MPTDAGSPLNRGGRTMFRRSGRLYGVALVVGLLVALGASRPHAHGSDGAPSQSCVVCHFSHDRSAPSAAGAEIPVATAVAFAEPATAPAPPPERAHRHRPRSRAPPC